MFDNRKTKAIASEGGGSLAMSLGVRTIDFPARQPLTGLGVPETRIQQVQGLPAALESVLNGSEP